MDRAIAEGQNILTGQTWLEHFMARGAGATSYGCLVDLIDLRFDLEKARREEIIEQSLIAISATMLAAAESLLESIVLRHDLDLGAELTAHRAMWRDAGIEEIAHDA